MANLPPPRLARKHLPVTMMMIPDGRCLDAVHSTPTHKHKRRVRDGFPKIYKGRGVFPGFLSRCAAHPSSSLILPTPQAWCHCYLFFLTTLPTIMFFKVILTFLAVGALSVNALSIPVARSPAPEPDCEFPRWSLAVSCPDLISGFFNSPRCNGPGRV